MKNIFEIVQEVLLSADKYQSEDNNLLKAKVYSDIMMMDEELLSLLLSNERIKEEFFTKVKDTLIFDKQKFAWLIESKEFLPDSYTRYSNKIGLTSNGNFISQKNDVVLDFPYKDCYLQGGQDKEDQKREEIFYHETIASDEVTRMLAPKVFTNAKRYTKEGIEEDIEFKDDDNLIIKGNNLIALSSLLNRYEGKVDIIYIDPPYNTRTDANTFVYNNNFNHSSWLTFMKNRLELAKKLLAETGIIFIDIDHYELFYLGVLADEIFGYENRIGVLAVVHNLKGRYNGFFSVAHENKLVYAKDYQYAKINEFSYDTASNFPHEDEISKYKTIGLQRTGSGSRREDRPNLFYPIYYNPEKKDLSLEKIEGYIEILPIDSGGVERRWRWGKEKVEKEWKTEIEIRKTSGEYKIYTKLRQKGDRPKTLWNKPEYSGTTGTNHLKGLLGENKFSFPKSVDLVVDTLDIASDSDSIIVDFFGGSGTTGEAVLRMNELDDGRRKFILVEQMDYINTVTVPRLHKVIEKSKETFVYCELLENSKELIDEIQNATDATITDIKEKIYRDERIVPYITRDELEAVDVEFEKLTLEEKKMALCALVDKNKLYVNLSDIDDKAYNISDKDRKFTESFYKREV